MHLNIGKALAEGTWDRTDAEKDAKEDWLDDIARFSTDAGVNAWTVRVKRALQRQSETAVLEAGWQMLFAQIDSDGGGTLDRVEFMQALRQNSITTEQCSDTDISDIFTAVDSSGDGRIDANEFTSWMLQLRIRKERYRRQHRKLDRQLVYLVDMVERFQEASATAITQLGWAQLFAKFDSDGSGCLDEDEFIAALRKYGIADQEVEVGDQELREVFILMDEDNSGKISSTEFANALRSTGTENYAMNYDAFQSSMFELVDYWSAGPTENQYIDFLKALFHAICCPIDIWSDEAEVQDGSARHPRDSWGVSQLGWDSSMHFQDGSTKYKLLRTHQVVSIVVDGRPDLSRVKRDEKRTPSRQHTRGSKLETAHVRAELPSSGQGADQATNATEEAATAEAATAKNADCAIYKAIRAVRMSPFLQDSSETPRYAGTIWNQDRMSGGGSKWASKPSKLDLGRPVTSTGTRCEKPGTTGLIERRVQRLGSPYFAQQRPMTTTLAGSPRLGGSGGLNKRGRNRPYTPLSPRATASPIRAGGFESRSPSNWLRTPNSPLQQREDYDSKPTLERYRDDRATPRMRQTLLGYSVESAPAPPVSSTLELPAVGVRAGSIASPRRGDTLEAVVMGGASPRRAIASLAAAATDTSATSDCTGTPRLRKHLDSDGAVKHLNYPSGAEMESAPVEQLVYYRCGHEGHEFVCTVRCAS